MAKTILVTGGAGFIGSHLCSALIKENNKVISLDDYSMGSEENHVEGVTYLSGHTKDIEKHISEYGTGDIDCIYHLGEYSRVEQSFADIERVLESNIVGTKAVFECARKRTCKVVYAGSSTKFADGGLGRDQSPYAWSKASNTELLRNYGEWFSLPYAITYFYNVYGPRERSERATGTVIAIFSRQHKERGVLTVTPPGTQRRNFTHVEDIVAGLLLVGEQGEGDEYGLGHPDSYSILEVAKLFGGTIEMGEEQRGNRMNSSVDRRRAELELGWKPKHNLPDYIETLIAKKS